MSGPVSVEAAARAVAQALEAVRRVNLGDGPGSPASGRALDALTLARRALALAEISEARARAEGVSDDRLS